MDFKEFLGKRIREERLKMNLTQEKLAESIDVTDAFIGQIERGERSLSIDTLIKISKRLNVTIDYLLKDSIGLNNDSFVNQINQLMNGRNIKQKQMALDVIKVMFSHLDDN